MNIKPIKNKRDYNGVLKKIESLMDAKRNSPDFDELEVLSILVEKYEDENFPIKSPDPIESIKFRMEQMGLSQRDLVPVIGSRSKVSEVLSGKRSLSVRMIRALHDTLKIPAEVLIQIK
ncbi:MAG: helix-turn-helix domain-containing protein [Spirochaetes bacterium]|nr:helix-turn-helix domain-containing protein [Spirochaetota bacterium]